uniref:Uncharacterized protein n=2 Tax=Ixodes scapularis TaxID=6945 RepID=A0A1S4LR12_IXOSC
KPSQIWDLEVNGLYAAKLREALPVSDFQWMTEEESACLNIHELPDDALTKYILDVSLRYPHDLHGTGFPLA